MRRTVRAVLPLAAVLLSIPLAAADTTSAEVARFSGRVNELRRAAGCAPLEWEPRVAAVAQEYSAEMARRDLLAHDADGSTMRDRLRRAGYVRRGPAAENIAYGHATVDEAVDAWMASPGHRENLEFCRFTHHGMGRKGSYWAHVLVALRPDQLLPPPSSGAAAPPPAPVRTRR